MKIRIGVESIASKGTNLSRAIARISIHRACELFVPRWNEKDEGAETAISRRLCFCFFFCLIRAREIYRKKKDHEDRKSLPFAVFFNIHVACSRFPCSWRHRNDAWPWGATLAPWMLITFPSLFSSEEGISFIVEISSLPAERNLPNVIIFRDNGTRAWTECHRELASSSLNLLAVNKKYIFVVKKNGNFLCNNKYTRVTEREK